MIRRGRGIGCMWYPIGFTVAANPSAATVSVNEDGTAILRTGTVETGQGALTVLGQIAAEELGLAPDDILQGWADPVFGLVDHVTGFALSKYLLAGFRVALCQGGAAHGGQQAQ